MTYDVGNPGPGLGEAQKCGRFKLVNGDPNPPLLITTNGNTYINKQSKTCTDSFPLKNTTYHHKNE